MSIAYVDSDGWLHTSLPEFKYQPLNHDLEETRFLVLQPCSGDMSNLAHPVRCNFEVQPLSEAQPFTAIKNARGYRNMHDAIEVDGRG
jgi:hypothetical protein